MTSNQHVVHAYRHIYRGGLQAVQYSSPARHVLRKRVRDAFRSGAAEDFSPRKIKNTIDFLGYAAKEKGLEHKMVKQLVHVWFWAGYTKSNKTNQKALKAEQLQIRTSAFDHFQVTLKMLNETMEMCLPTSFAKDKPLPVD